MQVINNLPMRKKTNMIPKGQFWKQSESKEEECLRTFWKIACILSLSAGICYYLQGIQIQKQPSGGVLIKRFLKICRKFTGEHPCWSVIYPSGVLLLQIQLFIVTWSVFVICYFITSGGFTCTSTDLARVTRFPDHDQI